MLRTALVLLVGSCAVAQSPSLLLNVNPTTNPQFGFHSSFPQDGVDLYGTALFTAVDGTSGREPWRTDGTAAGTFLLRDIRVGQPPFTNNYSSDPTGFAVFEDRAYFFATDGGGRGLWTTDGTTAGTTLVAPGISGAQLTPFGDRMLFAGDDGNTGVELWRTDGTAANTALVVDLWPGRCAKFQEPHNGSPSFLTPLSGSVFFVANDGQRGLELWRTDGTAAGTVVLDLVPGSTGSAPRDLVVFEGALWFAARHPILGEELWRSDGTAAGTAVFADLVAGGSSLPRQLTVAGGQLFFVASTPANGTELWVTDGSAGGTRLVRDVMPGVFSGNPDSLAAGAGKLLFRVNDPAIGREPWASDGTAAGTVPLGDLAPGTADSTNASRPMRFVATGSRRAWFRAWQQPYQPTLWVTDGTPAGTRVVTSLSSGNPNNSPELLMLADGKLLFAAADAQNGVEPWLLDPGATAHPVGHGCGLPAAALLGADPVLGAVMPLRGTAAPNRALAVVLGDVPAPVRVLRPGCAWALRLPGAVALTAAPVIAGTWSASLPLPQLPALSGLRVDLQAVVAGGVGFDVSNPLALQLGR